MFIKLDPRNKDPIYQQVVDQVRQLVAAGQLQPAAQLPTVRQLAVALRVNPNTIARVYTELEREGVLNTRQGLGVFVARPKAELTRTARIVWALLAQGGVYRAPAVPT
jgi:GntR family transcriptional regulator